MGDLEVLVLESLAVYALTADSRAVREIAALLLLRHLCSMWSKQH